MMGIEDIIIAVVNGVNIRNSMTIWRMVWDVFQMFDQTEILLIQVPTGSGSIEVIGNALRDVMGRPSWYGHDQSIFHKTVVYDYNNML